MATQAANAQSPFSNFPVGDSAAESSTILSPGRDAVKRSDVEVDQPFGNAPLLVDGYRPHPGDPVRYPFAGWNMLNIPPYLSCQRHVFRTVAKTEA